MTTVEMFAEDIKAAIECDAPVTLATTYGPPGSESSVAVLIAGHPVFHFTRGELLEEIYEAGCTVIEELEQAGRPATVVRH